MSSPRRIYIQGSGAVCGFGAGREPLLHAIFTGDSALRPLVRLAGDTKVAAEVPPEAADAEHLALRAIEEAGRGDALILATTKADLSGVVGDGDGLGCPARLAARLGADAAVSCACASGLTGIALAARWLRAGKAERVTVVGVDVLSGFILDGFAGLLALDEEACRPYDRTREGLSLGDGAGAILLGLEPTGIELAGWGESNDATHVTAPDREGKGLARAARLALDRAGLESHDIDFIHGHGTGTPFNDAMEGQALGLLYEDATPPFASSKAQLGHTLGAAGVLESIIAIEALQRATAPPNIRLQETDLPATVTLPRVATPLPRARAVLKWSAGFGGINAALVFRVA